MKVILLKYVENLGREGEIKEVSAGFARNYLIPRGLADIATPDLVKQIQQRKKKGGQQAVYDLATAEKMAEKLEGREFTVRARANAEGRLYASFSKEKILDMLKKEGFHLGREAVIGLPIKEVGEHEVTIALPHGLEARIVLIVEPE